MARMNGMLGVVVSSVAVLVVVIVGWVFFVSPQRSKADTLSTQVVAAKAELSGDEQLIATAKKQNTLGNAKAAERALPDTPRVSEILRQLTALAAESRTELETIAPGTVQPYGTSESLPIALTFKGRFFGLQKLLKLMRQSAGVSGSKIVSKGRLYTVDSIQFAGSAPAAGSPSGASADIQATISVNAFVYAPPPVVAGAPTTDTSTSAAGATG
jgi:Tfp pilus assembly protein PilO